MHNFPEIDFTLPGTVTGQTAHGVLSEDEWGRYALLKGVAPADVAASPFHQTLSAFENLERELKSIGMDFSCVVRTWLYADHILDWYADLNRARDTFFWSKDLYNHYIPASTGIGWSNGSDTRIVMGAFAAPHAGKAARAVFYVLFDRVYDVHLLRSRLLHALDEGAGDAHGVAFLPLGASVQNEDLHFSVSF